jgi:hypothetical protein
MVQTKPKTEITVGLQFRNKLMPKHYFKVLEVDGANNEARVWISSNPDQSYGWAENWNLTHMKWAFESGEYYLEPEIEKA